MPATSRRVSHRASLPLLEANITDREQYLLPQEVINYIINESKRTAENTNLFPALFPTDWLIYHLWAILNHINSPQNQNLNPLLTPSTIEWFKLIQLLIAAGLSVDSYTQSSGNVMLRRKIQQNKIFRSFKNDLIIIFGTQPIMKPSRNAPTWARKRIILYFVWKPPEVGPNTNIHVTGIRAIPYYIDDKNNIHHNHWYYSFGHYELTPNNTESWKSHSEWYSFVLYTLQEHDLVFPGPVNDDSLEFQNYRQHAAGRIKEALTRTSTLRPPPNLMPELIKPLLGPNQYHAPIPLPEEFIHEPEKFFSQVLQLQEHIKHLVKHTSVRAIILLNNQHTVTIA